MVKKKAVKKKAVKKKTNSKIENIENIKTGNISNTNRSQVAVGTRNIQIGMLTGEALEAIASLDRKKRESLIDAILKSYTPVLPDYPREFVLENRVDELTEALDYLQNHSILLVSGIGGVGKTTLARALVDKRPANIPLPFWFDSNKKVNATLGDILEKLASYMNKLDIAKFKIEGIETGQDDIDRLISELQRREQLWLIFDNLETILDENRKFRDEDMDKLFTSLRGSTHNAKIIVTSRVLPLLINGDSLIDIMDEKCELKGLKLNFAVKFLKKNGLERLERDKLEELATGVDGHPLALKLLIELVKEIGISDTLEDLSLYKQSKEETIKIARKLFDRLAGDEKELLENISVYRKPEAKTAIEKMFTDKTPKDAIRKLINKSLLETDRKGNYWLHPLIREFSYDDLKNKKKIHQLAWLYYIFLKLPDELTKKDDVQSLIEACYHACKGGEYDEAASIIFDLGLYEDLDRWGEYRTLIELYSGLLPEDHFSASILLNDRRTHGVVLGNLGLAYSALGKVDKAIEYHEQALSIAQEIGDRRGEGARLGNLGLAYSALGKVDKAIEYYKQALVIAREIGDRKIEGNALGNLGNAYYSLGQVDKAIEYYEQVLVIHKEIQDRKGESADLGSLGNAYYSLGQIDKAIEQHEQALVIAREIGDRRGKGTWLNNLGATLQDEKKKQYREALACYLLAREIRIQIKDPELKQTESNLNDLKEKLGEKEFEKLAAEVAPRAEEIVGVALRGLGRYEEAIKAYDEAIKIKPEDAEAWNNKGNALGDLGRYEEAIKAYDKALEINPELADTWYNKGLALSDLGKYEGAIKAYDEAIKIKPEYANAWAGEGNAFGKLGKHEEAIKAYDEVLKINPEDADAWVGKGLALIDLGKHEEAIKAYDKVLKINPELAGAWYRKGLALVNLWKNEEAIKAYDEVLKINPEDADAWVGKGLALYNIGKREEAIKAYNEAIKIKPEHAEAWYRKGNALGDLGEAIKAYDEAIKINPEYAEAWFNKGVVFDNLGKHGEARKAYDEAIKINPEYAEP